MDATSEPTLTTSRCYNSRYSQCSGTLYGALMIHKDVRAQPITPICTIKVILYLFITYQLVIHCTISKYKIQDVEGINM